MSKELEALERLAMPDELHIKECKKAGIGLIEDYEVVERALHRLEAIDNSNPSEALKSLKELRTIANMYCSFNGTQCEHNKELANIIEQALHRLEEIDNANPSEALECLERIDNTLCLNNIKGKLEFGIDTEEHTDCDSVIGMTEDLETIKQALLKAQEPKQYLKWEDLEFSEETKGLNVKMNNNDYILRYTLDVFGGKCCFLYNEAKSHHIELNKQFFNDLHLEEVKE